MKRIANILALTIATFTIFFAGCSNSIGGSVAGIDVTGSAVEKTLTVVATSNDDIISFGSSRTITPGKIVASDLTFYLWGIDTVNAKNVPVKKVVFSENGDGVSGSVPVDLGISNYKLYLAAVKNADAVTPTGTEVSYSADVTSVLAKSVLYANSNVDLRYNQIVKFYLSPFHLSGNGGTIELTLKTVDLKDDGTEELWSNPNYRVIISLQNITNSTVVEIAPVIAKADAGDAAVLGAKAVANDTNYKYKVWVQEPEITDTNPITPAPVTGWGCLASEGLKYTLTNVPSGTYNFVVDFTDGKKHYYYSEKLLVLVNQDITQTVKIPNVIARKPAPVKNFKVGYNDPDNPDSGYYLATFQWDDKSNNEEYFVLQLVDVSKDVAATVHKNGTYLDLSADAKDALQAVSDDTNTSIDPATYATDFAAVKAKWDAEVTASKISTGTISVMSLDKYIYQKTDSLYAAGSLDKNSTTVSLWLPLGSVYMARICAYNDSCTSLGSTEAEILVSNQEWLYSNSAALTSSTIPEEELATVYLSTGTNGVVTDSRTPKKWPKPEVDPNDRTSEEKDIPLAINRYRLTYNLDSGKFWQVKDNGKLNTVYNNENTTNAKQKVFGTYDSDVTGNISRIDSYKNKIVEYHTVTSVGTSIISPIAYNYASSNYATLYKDEKVWSSWNRGSVTGDVIEGSSHVFREISWAPVVASAGEDLTAAAKTEKGETTITYDIATTTFDSSKVDSDPSYYVNSNYGYVLSKGYTETNSSPKIADNSDIVEVRKVSSDGSLMIRSSLANYMTFENLDLFANYSATNADVNVFSPYNVDLRSENVRVTKSSDGGTNYVPANKSGDPNSVVTGTYTDGELDKTQFTISSFFNDLRFAIVESSSTPIYKKVVLEICETQGGASLGKTEVVASPTKFTVDDRTSKVGSADDGYEPLSNGDYVQYVFDKKVSDFTNGTYTAKIYAYTDWSEKVGFTRIITFKIFDPKYTAFAECDGTNYTGSKLYEYTGAGTPSPSDLNDPSKFVRSGIYTSYADAAANSVKVYYGVDAAY